MWARLALVEDEQDQAEAIKEAVHKAGYTCETFSSPWSFINAFHHDTFDIVLLDWVMPDLSGLDVLAHIKAVNEAVPVIMVTCCADDSDILQGFETGADDYIIKPVNTTILIARLRALQRRVTRAATSEASPITLGPYSFAPEALTVSFDGNVVRLTNREYELAQILFANPHRAFSRQYLLECLWGKSPMTQTRTLDTHIARLRTKLALGTANGIKLSTLYGYGYRLEFFDSCPSVVEDAV